MVPFSYFQNLLNSWVMNNHSSPVEAWTPGASDFSEAWRLQLSIFVLSCLPAFLILILVPVFCLYSVPLCLCGQSAFVSLRIRSWLKLGPVSRWSRGPDLRWIYSDLKGFKEI